MISFRRRNHEVPGLNTASLPDLIFSVLFFFMIVTHMRNVTPRVKYNVPEGTELPKLGKKQTVRYIYIGKPANGGQTEQIQIDNDFVNVNQIASYMSRLKAEMPPEEANQLTVSIKADRNTPMGIIADVREALRKAGVNKVNYSGELKNGNGNK